MTIMRDPVMTSDGYTFERQAILDWWEKGKIRERAKYGYWGIAGLSRGKGRNVNMGWKSKERGDQNI